MNIKRIVTPVYTENCYVVWDDENIGAIIDPGSGSEKIDKFITDNEIKIKAILLTHGHFDHVGAADELSKKYNVSVSLAHNEKEILDEGENNAEYRIVVPEKLKYFKDNDIINIGKISFKVIATPGHTQGSVSFYEEKEKVLFSGDTLFKATVGRWDFPTGSFYELENSVKTKLYTLPDDVLVYSGHGFSTSIGKEKETNGVVRC